MSSALAITAIICPGEGHVSSIIRPRLVDNRRRQWRSKQPAQCNATNSPILWPTPTSAVTPSLVKRSNPIAVAEQIVGWATAVDNASAIVGGVLGHNEPNPNRPF